MSRFVEFPLEGGGSVVVESRGAARGSGETLRGGWDTTRVVERAEQSFEGAIRRVQPAMQAVVAQLKAVADRPDEVQVEFGIELSAEVGAVIAGGSTTGNFRVTMTWRTDTSSKATADPESSGGA